MHSMHVEYARARPEWQRARDCLAGELAVKARGEEYLPRLEGQTDEEYRRYVQRASFFGGAARVLEDCVAAAFRRTPEVSAAGNGPADGLSGFVEDCDLAGTSVVELARAVLGEVLSVGRAGTLVLWDAGARRPWVSTWRAEQIEEWGWGRDKGHLTLERLGLRGEDGSLVRLWLHRGQCVREVWREGRVVERRFVRREQEALPVVPFVFHGPRSGSGALDRAPLADVVACNLDHYRLAADYRQGLHLAALPTAWVAGFDKGSPLRVGASEAWVSEVPGATAGFLEFRGTGLAHVEKALLDSERQMRELGDRLLGRSEAGATGQAGLSGVLAALERSFARLLGLASGWLTGQWSPAPPCVGIKFADVGAAPMKGADLAAVVEAWRAGAISRESLLEALRKGDVLPDGRTVKEEKALLYRVR